MIWKYNTIYVVCLCMIPALLPAQSPDCNNRVSGKVFDAGTGQPIPYANIFLKENGKGTVTDESGYYELDGLCDSVYTIVCSHIGCEHLIEKVPIHGDVRQDFKLEHNSVVLDELVVLAQAPQINTLHTTTSLSGAALDRLKGRTLGDALAQVQGVTTLNTGASIVKPVIRGLHSNRILILNNGVTQQSNQWGIEHAPEIDPFAAALITVVKGAAGVAYGPEAIGGVVKVESAPLPAQAGIGGSMATTGFSNGFLGVLSGTLEGKWSEQLPLSGRIQGTLKRGGNRRSPDYILANTGESEADFSWELGWKEKDFSLQTYYSRFQSDLGIFAGSHIGNLTDLKNAFESQTPLVRADFTYKISPPKQFIVHELAKVESNWQTENTGDFKVVIARQFNRRQEFDAHSRSSSNEQEPAMQFELTTWSADAVWKHTPLWNLSGKIGLQASTQRNTTDRGGLIPDYESSTFGVFWTERWRQFPNPWEFEAGLRFDMKNLRADEPGNRATDLNYNNASATLGVLYRVRENWKVFTTLNAAWRAPNVNELFSDGVHHGAAAYERGDLHLVSERAWQAELGTENSGRVISWQIAAFYQYIQDFIYLQPDKELVLTIRGAFPAFSYRQADAALYGADGAVTLELVPGLSWQNGFSLLRARNIELDDWLPLMPADRVKSSLKYTFSDELLFKNAYVLLGGQYVFKQTRIQAQTDFLPPPPAYPIFHAEAGASRGAFTMGLRVDNLGNLAYRDYLNRFRYFADELGVNISARIKYTF